MANQEMLYENIMCSKRELQTISIQLQFTVGTLIVGRVLLGTENTASFRDALNVNLRNETSFM